MNQTSGPQLRRSGSYYFDLIVFQVEDTLFKLPKIYFRNSSVFATIFTLPSGSEQDVEGTDAKPFVLHGINPVDFESLLKVMYPLSLNIVQLTQQEWISVLKLSTMWEFTELRERAKQELLKQEMKMGTVEKIECGRKYEIKEWVLEGYITLLRRPEIASDEEAERLGWKTVAKLYRLRDACLSISQSESPNLASQCCQCGRDFGGDSTYYCSYKSCRFYCNSCSPPITATRITTVPRRADYDFTKAVKMGFPEEL